LKCCLGYARQQLALPPAAHALTLIALSDYGLRGGLKTGFAAAGEDHENRSRN
jgi:hypothetical protein